MATSFYVIHHPDGCALEASARIRRWHGRSQVITVRDCGRTLVAIATGGYAQREHVRVARLPEQVDPFLAEMTAALPLVDALARIPTADLRQVDRGL